MKLLAPIEQLSSLTIELLRRLAYVAFERVTAGGSRRMEGSIGKSQLFLWKTDENRSLLARFDDGKTIWRTWKRNCAVTRPLSSKDIVRRIVRACTYLLPLCAATSRNFFPCLALSCLSYYFKGQVKRRTSSCAYLPTSTSFVQWRKKIDFLFWEGGEKKKIYVPVSSSTGFAPWSASVLTNKKTIFIKNKLHNSSLKN